MHVKIWVPYNRGKFLYTLYILSTHSWAFQSQNRLLKYKTISREWYFCQSRRLLIRDFITRSSGPYLSSRCLRSTMNSSTHRHMQTLSRVGTSLRMPPYLPFMPYYSYAFKMWIWYVVLGERCALASCKYWNRALIHALLDCIPEGNWIPIFMRGIAWDILVCMAPNIRTTGMYVINCQFGNTCAGKDLGRERGSKSLIRIKKFR